MLQGLALRASFGKRRHGTCVHCQQAKTLYICMHGVVMMMIDRYVTSDAQDGMAQLKGTGPNSGSLVCLFDDANDFSSRSVPTTKGDGSNVLN